MDAIDRGESVLVSAPTGSGKTLVAEYAAARAVASGGKAFYTTPIKALSNQKFAELSLRYGDDRVGLLTGDVSHQARAPMVVMTTEVLRNMLFARSSLLDDLAVVVLDEVHYLQDPYRGSVWEEVLVLTPPGVTFVSLSATVSNASDFGAWLTSVRGTTKVIVETHRPVTLHHHFAVAERGERAPHRAAPAPAGEAQSRRAVLDDRRRRNPRHRFRAPRRTEVIEYLAAEDMLPAITFIFSRAACDDAIRQCLQDGVRLTTPEERQRIRRLTEGAVDRLGDDDLATLGYGPWSAALEAGVAPHHAGLVPAFRQAVEQCFSEGLLKVVFATETLALGINMPARTVVVERFAKFRGLGHLGAHLGRVPAADRAGRPAGHRHRGPRLRPLVHGHALRPGGPHRHRPATRPALLLPPDLQPGGQPGAAVVTGRGPPTADVLVRPVAGAGGLRVPLRPARPAPGHPRGSGPHRRLDDDRGRARPGLHLPRVGPAGHRGAPPGAARRAGPRVAGRGGVGLHLRGPQAGRRRPRAAPEGGGGPVGPARRPGRRAAGRRAPCRTCAGPAVPTPDWPGP